MGSEKKKCQGASGTTAAKVSLCPGTTLQRLQFQHFFPAQKWQILLLSEVFMQTKIHQNAFAARALLRMMLGEFTQTLVGCGGNTRLIPIPDAFSVSISIVLGIFDSAPRHIAPLLIIKSLHLSRDVMKYMHMCPSIPIFQYQLLQNVNCDYVPYGVLQRLHTYNATISWASKKPDSQQCFIIISITTRNFCGQNFYINTYVYHVDFCSCISSSQTLFQLYNNCAGTFLVSFFITKPSTVGWYRNAHAENLTRNKNSNLDADYGMFDMKYSKFPPAMSTRVFRHRRKFWTVCNWRLKNDIPDLQIQIFQMP